ncbi:hypothetical protein MNBD_GAMMA05-1017 [hydrothermal vent metagenome]|uniref:Lipoprotein n=1 Tax=hydrothermal vent metagenome TaxID=652676 RepID=A0A3B0WFN6_9ZZZZ
MKILKTKALILLMMTFVLSACLTDTSIPEQITSLNVDCKTEEVQISEEVVELSGEQSWTAKCKGKSYTCSYLAESDMGCYELND